MKTPTPRTDAEYCKWIHGPECSNALANFARQLECELNSAEKNLADAQSDIAEEIKQGEIYLNKLSELRDAASDVCAAIINTANGEKEHQWSKKLSRLQNAITAAMPNDPLIPNQCCETKETGV